MQVREMVLRETGLQIDLERTVIAQIELQINFESLITGDISTQLEDHEAIQWELPEHPTLLVMGLGSMVLSAPGVLLVLKGLHMEVRSLNPSFGEFFVGSLL